MAKGLVEFSNRNRKVRLYEAEKVKYDLIVIGGGVTGAGIALDASLRGLKVLLLEKNDFASGTSSKSTKLIHGGLRYLKQLEFGLVRETGLERSVAHANACHLVHPENMFLPIVHKGSFSKWTAGLAISVYDLLANVPSDDKKVMMNKDATLKMEPLLDSEKVKSGIVYSEYRTDDARLTLELIKAAVRNGAEVFNYVSAEGFENGESTSRVVYCLDNDTGKEFQLTASQIVNATGPWADKVRLLENDTSDTNLHLSKGVHLVFSKEKLPLKNSIYFDAFDGRMLFAIPRGKVVYVGTTDTNFDGDMNNLRCSMEDVDYVLAAINGFFKAPYLSLADVQSSWVGLRPLIHQKGKPPTELSRKDEIFVSDSGMISIAGGKLTGFRKMAERVVDLVFELGGLSYTPCTTEHYKLSHDPFSDYSEYENYVAELSKKYNSTGVPAIDISILCATYGKDADYILSTAGLKDNDSKENKELLMKSQFEYCLAFESILHPMDFLERRTGWLFFDLPQAKHDLAWVTEQLGRELELDEDKSKEHLAESRARIENNSLEHLKSSKV